jgi:hypothetical protein
MPSKTVFCILSLLKKDVALKIRTIFSVKRKLETSLAIKSFLLHISIDSSLADNALVAAVTGIRSNSFLKLQRRKLDMHINGTCRFRTIGDDNTYKQVVKETKSAQPRIIPEERRA